MNDYYKTSGVGLREILDDSQVFYNTSSYIINPVNRMKPKNLYKDFYNKIKAIRIYYTNKNGVSFIIGDLSDRLLSFDYTVDVTLSTSSYVVLQADNNYGTSSWTSVTTT